MIRTTPLQQSMFLQRLPGCAPRAAYVVIASTSTATIAAVGAGRIARSNVATQPSDYVVIANDDARPHTRTA